MQIFFLASIVDCVSPWIQQQQQQSLKVIKSSQYPCGGDIFIAMGMGKNTIVRIPANTSHGGSTAHPLPTLVNGTPNSNSAHSTNAGASTGSNTGAGGEEGKPGQILQMAVGQ